MAQDLYLGGIAQVKAYRILQATVAEVVKSFEVGSVSEWFMLCHICYNPGTRAKELAGLLGVEAPLATRLVTNLTQARLVKSEPDPKDKRVKFLNCTPKGKALVAEAEHYLEAALWKLMEGVKPAELEVYQKVLGTIITNGGKR